MSIVTFKKIDEFILTNYKSEFLDFVSYYDHGEDNTLVFEKKFKPYFDFGLDIPLEITENKIILEALVSMTNTSPKDYPHNLTREKVDKEIKDNVYPILNTLISNYKSLGWEWANPNALDKYLSVDLISEDVYVKTPKELLEHINTLFKPIDNA